MEILCGELRVELERAVPRDSSSPNPSTPAKPPPTKVTVSNLVRSGPGGNVDARSKDTSSRSRIATASSACFRPIAS